MTPQNTPKLSDAQLTWLLSPIRSSRVGKDGKGFAHVEAWDIRRHLIRCFGFGGYSTELLFADLMHERETPAKNGGKSRWTVVYRCAVRLTVKVAGIELGRWHGIATGDAINLPSVSDAHDLALKTADSQALKRAAVNLGDQFGLSLYNNGSHDAVVLRTLAHASGGDLPASDPPVQPEPQAALPPAPEPQAAQAAPQPTAPPQPPTAPQPDEREKEYAAMMHAAQKVNFTEGLPDQFRSFFGVPVEEGTADQFRQARTLMEES
ncbi:Rad52/Rad22 family DNA repair protein [Streptomyces sp. 549]|uniref:Rad52/Rad22 family DNA repair protein n=1 Tax=Streptomyces sp. 549 TaxID=3049076 RepID=UPI0024C26907|nr:Rad52/Rad22 family DNA repair protein [Streptomyces sp. 549]MDK1476822.1 Rad52/Rad22 family DNA repair protein [Streptomyces sp. 549]